MFKKLKKRLIGIKESNVIYWNRNENKSRTILVNSFPKNGEILKEKDYFAVKDYEKAIYYNKGELVDVLGGGVYEITKDAKVTGTEIVWVNTSIIKMKWGIPRSSGILTKDKVIIGLHGDIKVRISDVIRFYQDVVGGKKVWSKSELREWIINLIHTSLRDIFKNYSVDQIIMENRERVLNLLISKVSNVFSKYGLELEGFNIIGIKKPDDNQ